ncbi:GlsB/YeaQ/YmgE family stress response membrane protein [Pseudoroseicyclus tamaricis]|uniref:GlsB/YeaQ/YmgE family stress response membrane protein n=1 Tax=Pseudoroseicyclus tamaricis TaxID=2705421 RepID=A0A6B2JU47_9RHOB|nr:GlsB/YeaQ/YmgE family stress response membrane protein [Pseudoroseicyclus tamaricis]NDV01818.1 GlsB/YeaQ/YmgE family stress response membrane protein [Pseudoroseicyclus tamaricis]
MEDLIQGIGIFMLIVLALIGLVAGWIAGMVAGRDKGLYMIVGVVAALATPFILAALGVTALAAGGVLLVLIVGVIGAVIVLAIVQALKGGRKKNTPPR